MNSAMDDWWSPKVRRDLKKTSCGAGLAGHLIYAEKNASGWDDAFWERGNYGKIMGNSSEHVGTSCERIGKY